MTNASLPKENKPEDLTLPQALDLLAIRAAAGPPAKKRGFRKGAPKAAGPKKAPKRAAKKKAPARKKSPSGA